MIDKYAFRSLTPAHLGWSEVPAEPDFEGEVGWVHIASRTGTGATFSQGRKTGNQLVHLEGGVTLPEVLKRLQDEPTFHLRLEMLGEMGELTSNHDPVEESRMLAWVLTLLGLPLEPGSSIGDVIAVLEPLCPWLLWSKPLPVEEKGVTPGTRDRHLIGIRNGLMVEVFFRQERLYAISVTDLELMILNDEMEGVGKARKDDVLQERLTALQADPVPFALQRASYVKRERVEWSRGINVPKSAPPPAREIQKFEVDVPVNPAGTNPADMDVEDIGAALRAAAVRQTHGNMDKRYGSLRGLLEQATDGDLLTHCIDRCSSPAITKIAHPEMPGLGRAAWVLHDLHYQIMNGGGLEAWFTTHLEGAHDTMAALHLIRAVEMEKFLCGFAGRAAQDGCNVVDPESWKTYFQYDRRAAEESEALRLAPGIIPRFRAWALASPEAIAATDNVLQEERNARVSVPGKEVLHVLAGALAETSAVMIERRDHHSPNGESIPGMDTARIRITAAMDKITRSEHERIRKKYTSLSDAVLTSPVKNVLRHVAYYSGCPRPGNLTEENGPVRMAVCLHALHMTAHSSIDEWFESSWASHGHETLHYLQEVGAAELAWQLSRMGALGSLEEAEEGNGLYWMTLFSNHEETLPTSDQMEHLLAPIPSLYREYWEQCGVEAAA